MLKVLLILLLTTIGTRIVTANGSLFSKFNSAFALEDQETDTEKSEKKENKVVEDEKVLLHYAVKRSVVKEDANVHLAPKDHNPYSSLFGKPSTPPPDFY